MTESAQYQAVRSELDEVCASCGREPGDVMLVAVSKTVGPDAVARAIEGGARDFGENRPDDLVEKKAAFPHVRWHFIGNVQSRRIPDIVANAYLIHSVYKIDHLAKIDAAAKEAGKIQNILLEINSGEESKDGISPDLALGFAAAASRLPNIRLCGLMTMAPQGDLEEARRCFSRLRELRDDILTFGSVDENYFNELSMGMSEDWQVAVEEGATIIRVGRAVFSADFA